MSATGIAPALQKCVLLIEDSEDVMLLVQFALHEHGNGKYRLEWATRLSEGLDQIRQGGVDVVLLDLDLPGSSGPLSWAWVRAVSPKLPVLVLTGDTSEYIELAALAGRVDEYLLEELGSGSQLFDAIQATLSRTTQGKNKL